MTKPTAYLMFGAQGSGKSTQGEELAERLSLPFFDTGHELRQVAKSRSPLARSITKSMKAGELVGNKTLETVINQFLAKHPVERGIVLDGFPRTLEEVELFQRLAKRYSWRVTGIFIHISDQTTIKRISKRAEIENRSDDQPKIIAERIAIFKEETMPVVEYLRNHHQLWEIDGEPSPAEVTKEIAAKLAEND